MPDDLTDFLARYERDDNEWWRLGSGEHLNLFDAAIERAEQAETERDEAKRVLAEEIAVIAGERMATRRIDVLELIHERDALKATIERARALAENARGAGGVLCTCADCADDWNPASGHHEPRWTSWDLNPAEVLAALRPSDDRAEIAARIHTLDQPAKFSQCGQCGRPFSERACGPTHALVAHERGGDLTRHLPGHAAPAPRRLTEQQGGIPNDDITSDDPYQRGI